MARKTFEEIIVENCDFRQKSLLRPAKIAAVTPDTGVEIKSKAAYHVIKDCADMAVRYLPLYAWSWYDNPVDELRDKVTKGSIESFIKRVNDNTNEHKRSLQHLLDVVVNDLLKSGITNEESSFNSSEMDDSDDIYGDYDYEDSHSIDKTPDTDALSLLLKWID